MGGEILEQVALKGCGRPIPATNQGQVRQGFEETDLVEGVSGHGRGLGEDDL